MRKMILCILAAGMLLAAAGCSSAAELTESASVVSAQEMSSLQTKPAENVSATEIQDSGIEAESAAEEVPEDTVEITLPAQYGAEEMTQAECDAAASANNYESITLNEDGSMTYVMSESRHQQLLQDTANSIDASLESMCGSETYPNIVTITPNVDYTAFTVLTQSEVLGTEETLSVMNFYLYGGMYNAMAGNPDAVIHVTYQNCNTNEILGEADSSEIASGSAGSFVDVAADSWYYDAVSWAAADGIIYGTDETHFSPEEPCTRVQLITMLWRLAGEPAAEGTESSWSDVTDASPGYTAILWAAEQGIASGTSDTEFSPDETVTRAQAMMFLWRYAGSPEPQSMESIFDDIGTDDESSTAVMWAVEQNIAAGTTENTFEPDAECTRGQITAFLYRGFGS